ncbi:Similar to X-element\ORF2: Probable RNA-directed DNA polymerase from transposon X-element (Drosophila melanogaster) [Cotesia congregata]|uniref:Similar to X-element\ORF2: Probable RNA-directed DNA polymerase from transposon X-element (Drosophila melanogaster) n=1 Tax=Cotesia congregata TaxID=51543 RepID=A0A8J2EB59_COTCN|nr:Similar to X-element\ORF2: Probable RNA-directed DNA polymerase from transposon X-element (Drosophila melanogaster) [Cotesia congregata]
MWVEDMVTNSDHLPVTIRLHTGPVGNLVQAEQNSMQPSPLRWNENHADRFRHYITWSSLIKIDINSASVDDFNKQLTVAITEAAREAQMSRASRKNPPEGRSKPWFDKSCKDQKAMLKNILRQCKLSNNSYPIWAIYRQSKKDYYSYLRLKKQEYINVIQAKFAKTRNTKDFWDTMKLVRRSSRSQNSIALVEWENFFHKAYPPRITSNPTWHSDLNQQFDVEITLEESLKKCKSNKAAGMDNISNEFLKNLPGNWQLFILAFFNKILVTETLPLDWTKNITTMLFKKGDPTDPENYRSIALINNITKVFTQIYSRIKKGAETEKIIPEEQSGFQPGKPCADNVFTLLALLQMKLRFGKPVYTLFIDFRRAFDSVPHDKLWTKLMNLGLSSKLINILKILYDNAQMKVRVNGQLSEQANVTLGVLQGEVLSPILFILYLSDITGNSSPPKQPAAFPQARETTIPLIFMADLQVFRALAYWSGSGRLRPILLFSILFTPTSVVLSSPTGFLRLWTGLCFLYCVCPIPHLILGSWNSDMEKPQRRTHTSTIRAGISSR